MLLLIFGFTGSWLLLGLFSSCGKWGLLSSAVHGLLIVVVSLVAERGVSVRGFQQLQLATLEPGLNTCGHMGFVATWHVGS